MHSCFEQLITPSSRPFFQIVPAAASASRPSSLAAVFVPSSDVDWDASDETAVRSNGRRNGLGQIVALAESESESKSVVIDEQTVSEQTRDGAAIDMISRLAAPGDRRTKASNAANRPKAK